MHSFAPKTESQGAARVLLQSGRVGDVDGHAVDGRGEAVQPRRHRDREAQRRKLGFVGGTLQASVGHDVDVPDRETQHAHGPRDLDQRGMARGRFDKGQQDHARQAGRHAIKGSA